MHALALLTLAQMPWTANLPARGVAFDILRPSFREGFTSATGAAAFISGRLPTGGVAIRVELPLAYGSMDNSSFSFGNPYVGVETARETGLIFELGARGPLASDGEIATQVGALSDIDRYFAFAPDVATIEGRVRWRLRDTSGFTFDAGGGPSTLFPTQGGGDDIELILHHHMMAGYNGKDVWVLLGFAGWTFITEDLGGVGERTIDEVGASFGLTGKVRPAFHVLVPLDNDFNSAVGVVFGVGVAIPIK